MQIEEPTLEMGSDGLVALRVGPWWTHKHSYLRRYIDIFARGMKRKWQTRVFVDLYSGPGLLVERGSNREYEGSPLIAVGHPTGFTHYFFNDVDSRNAEALKQRLKRRGIANCRIYSLPAEQAALNIAADLRRLRFEAGDFVGLAFIDPVGSPHSMVSLTALTALTDGMRLDLLITFHTQSYKRMLGQAASRYRRGTLQVQDLEGICAIFGIDASEMAQFLEKRASTRFLLDLYQKALQRLGYHFFESEEGIEPVIRNTVKAPLYHLIFASKHERGGEFWAKIKRGATPQGSFW
jgi:three-Cys-motif partner protein